MLAPADADVLATAAGGPEPTRARWRQRQARRAASIPALIASDSPRASSSAGTVSVPAWAWAVFAGSVLTVLAGVAAKMLLADLYQVPHWASPAFVAVVLGVVTVASIRDRRHPPHQTGPGRHRLPVPAPPPEDRQPSPG